MWVFMNDAMFSAVEDRDDSSRVVVRARIKGDLETAFDVDPRVVTESDESDYRFRIFVTKEKLKEVIEIYVDDHLNYDNFKNSIDPKDKARKNAYMKVWQAMYDWQCKLYGYTQWWLDYRNRR